MKRLKSLILVTQLSLFLLNSVDAQLQNSIRGDTSIDVSKIVNTPFGVTRKSNVLYIPNYHHLKIQSDVIQIINSKTGETTKEYINIEPAIKKTDSQFNSPQIIISSAENNGWITYAYGNFFIPSSEPVTYFRANYLVPSPPLEKNNQLIYIFNGLGNIVSGVSHIIQPVLQWGKSPAGGGDYWAICNWYVTSNRLFFHDSLIIVSPGTQLESIIKLTSTSNNSYTYNSLYSGYGLGLLVENLPNLTNPYVVFEAYNLNNCNQYPLDEKIKMKSIKILTNIENPNYIWHTFEQANEPVNDCGQFTKIINPSLNGGEVDINFHSPSSINNFTDIHFYPNPFRDYLHIAPNILIYNCKIELSNFSGELIFTDFYNSLDQEFNIDFASLKEGLYFLKFIYDNKYHTFKIMKIH
jgi:hypothetical protein